MTMDKILGLLDKKGVKVNEKTREVIERYREELETAKASDEIAISDILNNLITEDYLTLKSFAVFGRITGGIINDPKKSEFLDRVFVFASNGWVAVYDTEMCRMELRGV